MTGMLWLAALCSLAIHGAAAVTLTVNLDTTYQTMDGFGFCEGFGRASNVVDLPSTQRTYALDLLFSTTKGAGLTILRNRIGSGGSGDSIEPTNPGSPSATPKYVWDGNDKGQVWISQQAKAYGVKTFYADAWSAPGFMKTNGVETNGGYLCGVTGHSCSSGDWKQAYANYLVQYIKYYKGVGIDITHLGFLNEPDYTTAYSSMNSDGTQAADMIKVLRPTLNSAGYSNIGIVCCDAVGWPTATKIANQMIAAGVESQLAVISSHAYSGDPNSALSTSRQIWETEAADLSADGTFSTVFYSNGGAGEGLTWANKIYTGIINARLSAYLYWIGAGGSTTNSGLIMIANGNATPSKRLWVFGMWSRYVRPGAVRVGTTGSATGLTFTAFKNTDGTVSVQVINNGGSAQSVTVATSGGSGFTAKSVAAYITDNNNAIANLSASLSNGQATANVPAKAMVTFVLSGTTGGVTTAPGTTTTPRTTTTSTGTSPSGCTVAIYGQCGGSGYTGCKTCAAGSTCKYSNDFYSQCL